MRPWMRPAALALALLAGAGTSGSTATPDIPAGSASPPAATLDPDLAAQLDELARAALTDGVTGAVVGISDPVRGSHLQAYGTADTTGTPMTTDVHYRIASVTKTFTAQAVLRLADQGRLSLDDPLEEYVPDIPHGEEITVRHLLGMRGGVYDFVADEEFMARYAADPLLPGWSPYDVLEIIRAHADEATPPGQATVYSNSEYVLLGLVIERVTGRSAQQYTTTVIEDLGLPETSYPTTAALPEPFTRGYVNTDSELAPADPGADEPRDVTLSNPVVPFTAGAVVSTVPDMVRYAEQLATGVGLAPETARLRQDWTPLTSTGLRVQYGLGVLQLGNWVGHNGSVFGYSDMVSHLPEEEASVVVMVNAADGEAVPATDLWFEIVTLLYPDSLPTW
ncbi:D-alanyl-D-alanine carboxypeptidase [Geodermatophilus bullaregiensis]|uniref:serine hydrolase domain-containing protein n=1 Tax=Geodermatophilus bullaregiensis TaxID=1564160 RepID=UPI00195A0792|nr:serine hydrolase domain-containing protein [Geodermatophilus bullaregiensis]MBM7809129.1 D-alanyl-D-alanine carboxypeptidase [Geodermatophilus bullaregiensis]